MKYRLKKLIALLMALLMVVNLAPVSAFADETGENPGSTEPNDQDQYIIESPRRGLGDPPETDASFDVSISFFDKLDKNVGVAPSFENETYYLICGIGNISAGQFEENAPYRILKLDDLKGYSGTYNVGIDSFSTDPSNAGSNMVAYSELTDEQKATLSVYLIHSQDWLFPNLTINDVGGHQLSNFTNAVIRGFEGYEVCGNTSIHPTGKSYNENCDYEINYHQSVPLDISVVIRYPAGETLTIAEADKHIAYLKAHDQYETYHYAIDLSKPTERKENEFVYHVNNTWRDGKEYSLKWDVEFKAGTKQQDDQFNYGSDCSYVPEDKIDWFIENSTFAGFNVSIGSKETEITGTTENDDVIQHIRYVINLYKPFVETTMLQPETVLGGAYEYGIVADELIQSGHTETNFAVNKFSYGGSGNADNIDIDGSGEEPMPFMIGNIVDQFNLTQGTKVDVDLYVTQEDKIGRAHV